MKNEKYFALLAFLLLWLGLFHFSGILNAGFHLTDDHEIVLFNDLLEKQGLFSLLTTETSTDFLTRFRPLYYPHRILITSLIGTNTTLWSIYFCVLGVMTSYFFFCGLRLLKFSILPAFLFPLFAFWGEQTAVWWRLGTAETLGILFASLSAYCMGKELSMKTLSLARLWNFGFIIFAIFAALSKESFILMIPALLFWKIWSFASSLPYEADFWKNYQKALKINLLSIVCLGIISIIFIYFIQTQTKASQTIFNATGEDDTHFRNTILQYILFKLITFNKLNILFLGFIALVLFAAADDFKNAKHRVIAILREILPAFLLTLLIIVPQFILYARTDLYERYLIPTTIGLAFFAVFLIQMILKQDFIKQYLKIAFCVLGLVGLYFPLGKAYFSGNDFAQQGVQSNAFLRFIKSVTNEESGILLVANPIQHNEWIHSFYRFLNSSAYRRKNIYLQLYTFPNPNSPQDLVDAQKTHISKLFENQLFDLERDKENIKCIAFLPSKETEIKFLEAQKDWLQTLNLGKNVFGDFIIYSN
jgi:hypothetical protein